MIVKIALENFCGFKNLDIDLKRTNIFVGRNNTGKTTILRAIELLYNFLQQDQYNSSFFFFEDLNELFYKDSNTLKISIQFKSDKLLDLIIIRNIKNINEQCKKIEDLKKRIDKRIKRIEKDKEIWIRDKNKNELVKLIQNNQERTNGNKYKNRSTIPEMKSFQEEILKIVEEEIKSAILVQIFENSEIIFEEIIIKRENYYRSSLIFEMREIFGPHFKDSQKINQLIKSDYKLQINSTSQTIMLYRNLFMKGFKPSLNDFLGKYISGFISLDEIDNKLMITMNDNEGNYIIPFQSMGDGFKSLLKLYSFLLEENSIILVDEIEQSFHLGYLEIICKEFIKQLDHHQFFFTTHSLEFIKIMLGTLKEQSEKDSFQIVRMVRDFDGLDRIVLDYESINDELENLKVDLRGY